MDFGFIDSPYLFAYVNCSTSLKDRESSNDESNPNYSLNHHSPVNKKENAVKERNNFMNVILNASKTKKETQNEKILPLIWNTKNVSPVNPEDLMVCSSEEEFSPFISSSPNSDALKIVKTPQRIVPTIEEFKRFASDSNFQSSKDIGFENSFIFENNSIISRRGLNDADSENSETDCSENSIIFENDSHKILQEDSLKIIQPFYETEKISRHISFSENISLYPVGKKSSEREKCYVLGQESTVVSAKSCTCTPVALNRDLLWSDENNRISYQVKVNELDNLSNIQDFFQTKNSSVKMDFSSDIYSLSTPNKKQLLGSGVTFLKTPEHNNSSILTIPSEDIFEMSTENLRSRRSLISEFDTKYDFIGLEMHNNADNFEFENEYKNTNEEGFQLCQNSEYFQQSESIARTEVKEIFHFEISDMAHNNSNKFHTKILSDVIPVNVSKTKYQDGLKGSRNTDNDLSPFDLAISDDHISENLDLGYDFKLSWNKSQFDFVITPKVIPKNVCKVECLNELRNSSKFDFGLQTSDKTNIVLSVRENSNIEKFPSVLFTTNQQCNSFNKTSEQMVPNPNSKNITDSKVLPQIIDSPVMEKETISVPSSQPLIEMENGILYPEVNLRTKQTSVQIVPYRVKDLGISTNSSLEFSSNLDFIGKTLDFNYLEFSARNDDLMFEKYNGKYLLNETEANSTSTKKYITFPTISENLIKEDEFVATKKEIYFNDTVLKSNTDEKEDNSDVDLDDFTSAPEYCSSSSEVFYDMEEFYETSDSGSSEKENFYNDSFINSATDAPVSDFKKKCILQTGKTNLCKSLTSSSTKNNSTSNIFNLNEPVIIKYLNEHTKQIDEMLIYPIEYYEKLLENVGRKNSGREEVFQKLIDRSKIYVGKPFGILLNVKDIRKKRELVPKEIISSGEMSRQNNSEETNMLGTNNSPVDYHGTNDLESFASEENVYAGKKFDQSFKEGQISFHNSRISYPRKLRQNQMSIHKEAVQIKVNTATDSKKIRQNETTSYDNIPPENERAVFVPRTLQSNELRTCIKNIQPKNSFTISCARKVQQNEIEKQQESVQIRNDNIINPFYSKTCTLPKVSRDSSAIYLRKNTNVYSNDQKKVALSNSNYRRQKGYCFPPPIKKINAVSSDSTCCCQENKQKRWFHVGKQPLKSASYKTNSRNPYTIAVYTTNQREIRTLSKAQSTANLTESSKKPNFLRLKGNLIHHSDDCFTSRATQKYNSFSNERFIGSFQEKIPQKMVSFSNKQIKIDEIISSDFKSYFNSYAKRGSRLKSGSVISKSNSNYWLKKAGIIYNERSLKVAEESFAEIARKKLVLNIYDYIQYLIILSRREKICLADLIQQLKTPDILGSSEYKKGVYSSVPNLSGNSGFKNPNQYAKQLGKESPGNNGFKNLRHYTKRLEKQSSLQVPERLSNFPISSTPRKIIFRN